MLALVTPTQVSIASALGYTSIACWLCAQFPQVLKNYNLKSVEGLALPFLVNWLSGDITNFIGCVLTDQLPFQTYLAAYFCVIDFTLVYQYYLYQRPTPVAHSGHQHHVHYAARPMSPPQTLFSPPPHHRTHSTSSTALFSAPSSASTARPRPPRSTSMFGFQTMSSSQYLPGSESPPVTTTDSYQDLYEAALDVARAAERVSSRRSRSTRGFSRRSTNVVGSDINEEEGGGGEGMMASFHSDMTAMTTSTVEEDRKRMSQSTGALLDSRGRTLTRLTISRPETPLETEDQMPGLPGEDEGVRLQRPAIPVRSKSRSLSLARGSSGRGRARRAAGVALMSLGLLAGWGNYRIGGDHSVGRVLAQPIGTTITSSLPPIRHPQPAIWPIAKSMGSVDLSEVLTAVTFDGRDPNQDRNHQHNHSRPNPEDDFPPPMTWQHVIGRISAWACTTLYLTSRLPQIWKNFMRKSVEGLSILLFFFAFCGNLTYVMSILLNPAGSANPSDASHYLLEALPYLMGSGGTLVFDLTIMLQSLIYGSAPPVEAASLIGRRPTWRRRRVHTEDGILHGRAGMSSPGGAGFGERQPLLSESNLRERGISPRTALRMKFDDGVAGVPASGRSRQVTAESPVSPRS